jgi:hypothetical protein
VHFGPKVPFKSSAMIFIPKLTSAACEPLAGGFLDAALHPTAVRHRIWSANSGIEPVSPIMSG